MLQYVDTMSACCKSKIGENIMINKKVMLLFVGGIVANVVDVGAMNMQQRILERFRPKMVKVFEEVVSKSLSPTRFIATLNDTQLSFVVAAALGGDGLFGGVDSLASDLDLISKLREFVFILAREYEQDHPTSPRVATDTSSLRRGINSLFEINPEGTSAENIVRGLTNEQLTKFVQNSINGIEVFIDTEHPELSETFLFDDQQLQVSQIFLNGGAGRSYPSLRAFIAHVVGMYERDHPRTSEATAGV
jgi:hypothetical protein